MMKTVSSMISFPGNSRIREGTEQSYFRNRYNWTRMPGIVIRAQKRKIKSTCNGLAKDPTASWIPQIRRKAASAANPVHRRTERNLFGHILSAEKLAQFPFRLLFLQTVNKPERPVKQGKRSRDQRKDTEGITDRGFLQKSKNAGRHKEDHGNQQEGKAQNLIDFSSLINRNCH